MWQRLRRERGTVSPIISKILGNSAKGPSSRQNPYSLNLATNATRISPGTPAA
jgi:hypothetical protein